MWRLLQVKRKLIAVLFAPPGFLGEKQAKSNRVNKKAMLVDVGAFRFVSGYRRMGLLTVATSIHPPTAKEFLP